MGIINKIFDFEKKTELFFVGVCLFVCVLLNRFQTGCKSNFNSLSAPWSDLDFRTTNCDNRWIGFPVYLRHTQLIASKF